MQDRIDSVRAAVAEENWYAGLSLALSMPDICGRISSTERGRQRYINWAEKYIVPTYTAPVGISNTPKVFMSGEDLYKLRCAYLHAGEFELDDPATKDALERFHFIAPLPRMTIHRNKIDRALQLQVDLFCEDMAQAVERWLAEIAGDVETMKRVAALPSIQKFDSSRPIVF